MSSHAPSDTDLRKRIKANREDVIRYICDPYVIMHHLDLSNDQIREITDAADMDRRKGCDCLVTILLQSKPSKLGLLWEKAKERDLRLLYKILDGQMDSDLKKMLNKQYRAFEKCRSLIADNVITDDVIDYLAQHRVLLEADESVIDDKKSKGKTELILRIPTRHEKWFEKLIEALEKKPVHNHIVEKLCKTLADEPDGLFVSSDSDGLLCCDGAGSADHDKDEFALAKGMISECSPESTPTLVIDTSLEEKIIQLLKDENRPLRAIEIARNLNIEKSSVNPSLYELHKKRLVKIEKIGDKFLPHFLLVTP